MYVNEETAEYLNNLLQATFQMNSHSDNCAYYLDANAFTQAQEIFHEKYAHKFPAWADNITTLMIQLGIRPVRLGLEANVDEYSNHLACFEAVRDALEAYRNKVYQVVDVADMNEDREIVNFLDDYLVEIALYIKQVNIWAKKAGEMSPEKFDKYFESFTII